MKTTSLSIFNEQSADKGHVQVSLCPVCALFLLMLFVHLFEHSRSFRAQRNGLVCIKLHRTFWRSWSCVHFSLRISLCTDILIFFYHATTMFIIQNHICFLFFCRFSTILWTAVVLAVIFPSIAPFSHPIVRSVECIIACCLTVVVGCYTGTLTTMKCQPFLVIQIGAKLLVYCR